MDNNCPISRSSSERKLGVKDSGVMETEAKEGKNESSGGQEKQKKRRRDSVER